MSAMGWGRVGGRRIATAMLTVALVAGVTGCGTDDDGIDAGTGAGPGGTEAPTTAPPGDGAAPGDDDPSDSDGPTGECSGASVPDDGLAAGDDVPDRIVAAMESVREAAQACDYTRLAEIALADGEFNATFGEDFTEVDALAAYWEEREADEQITGVLARLVQMRVSEVDTTGGGEGEAVRMVVAPRALHDDDDEAREELISVFGAEAEGWYADGQYLGWRVGFTGDGDWRFFVSGD
jgi:hypothetical protein